MVHDGKHLSLIILKDSSWLPGEASWGHVDMCGHHGTTCLVWENSVHFYILLPLYHQHRLNSLKTRDLLEPDPQNWFASLLGNPDFAVISLSVLKSAAVPFIEDCGSAD